MAKSWLEIEPEQIEPIKRAEDVYRKASQLGSAQRKASPSRRC
jgi:hypothetical protein